MNTRPGMQPNESEQEYDKRIEEEARIAGVDPADHKAEIARQTGEAYPPQQPASFVDPES